MNRYILLYAAGMLCFMSVMTAAGNTMNGDACGMNDTVVKTAPHDIMERMAERNSRMTRIGGMAYGNPALRQFMYCGSYTTVGIGYDNTKLDEAVSVQDGKGHNGMYIGADSYVRYKNSTLWGTGRYEAGHTLAPVWNEVADAQLVYPYFTADAIGGDMNDETYSFTGGYAVYDGRLAWGAELGYTAGHHYRDVDPRPRNITGKLDVKAGVAYRAAGKYIIGVGADFMKYKQTGDIDFVSELGQATVYHLTGLGTDYVRFRGNGLNTHYDGECYGLQANVLPCDSNGMSATVRLARFTLETILTDMNKLPLNSLWHNSMEAQIGYSRRGTTSWGVAADFTAWRRHGNENIFGDAASSVYPKIGTVNMYADNAYTAGVSGVIEHGFSGMTLSYLPRAAYSHRCQVYADPAREWLVNNWRMSHDVKAGGMIGRHWHGEAGVSWTFSSPVSSHLVAGDAADSEQKLMNALYSDFLYASAACRRYSASVTVTYAPDSGRALRMSVEYGRDSYGYGTNGNTVGISAAMVF